MAQDGHFTYGDASGTVYSPDYMRGFAGVAVTLLRLAAPDRMPHQLSLESFQQRVLSRSRLTMPSWDTT